MTDYGQDLQFGTFLTPDASQPDRVVELALLTETAGLELATIQDHPYQARFLDAWALIATIAARTSTLRLTTNVTNLPLRPPFVLAKTVASLDLLSRGRIELGLGAGAFWDAVAAAGGPRRTPKEASRRWPRESRSSARPGTPRSGRYASTVSTIAPPASTPARHRRTTSRSGSGRSDRRCWP